MSAVDTEFSGHGPTVNLAIALRELLAVVDDLNERDPDDRLYPQNQTTLETAMARVEYATRQAVDIAGPVDLPGKELH